jgi:hypothetical protein
MAADRMWHGENLFYDVVIRMNTTQRLRKTRFLLIGSMVIYGLLTLEQSAWCAQVDSEKIDLILHTSIISKTGPHGLSTEGVVYQGLLGVVATIQTRRLGMGDKNWDEKNPKWKPIRDRIRADLEKDLPTLPAAAAAAYAEWERCEAAKCYAQDIASNLQPTDVEAILAYFDTPEGKRFQTFQQEIGSIYGAGIVSFMPPRLQQTAAMHPNNGQDSQAKSIPPSAEQMQRFLRMLKLSILFQSTKAATEVGKSGKQDSSGGEVFALFMAAAINKNKAKLEELDLQYRNDLAGFEVFSETDASRHFIEALAKADAKSDSRMKSALEVLQGIANKHQQEWRVLLKAELSQ